MLRLFDANKGTIKTLDNIEEFYIEYVNGGFHTLSFDIEQKHPLFSFIQEEILLEYDEIYYVIRNINKRSSKATVTCDIWDDEWKMGFYEAYEPGSQTCVECLNDIRPSGWSIMDNAYITTKYAYELKYVTSYALFLKIQQTFGVAYEIDNKNKILRLINPKQNRDRGAYFTDELNLKELTYKNSSEDLVTRLYAYGKKDLSFESINNGNKYIDDHTYTNEVLTGYWKDESYTDAQSLLLAAKRKLKELALPTRSYSCTVTDVASVDEKYTFLHVELYDLVTLLDRNSKVRRQHVVEKYKLYPLEGNRNVVTLSSEAKQVSKSIKSISNTIETANESGGFVYEAVQNATDLITGQKGGYVVLDPPQKPERILVMNTPDKRTATKCWQFNLAGLGYSANGIDGNYGTAITMDGAIVANYITAGSMSAYRIKTGKLVSTNYAANQSGMSIDMDLGSIDSKNFKVDSSGNVTLANATLSGGTLQSANYAANVSGTKINLANGAIDSKNFNVDSNGNATLSNATVSGSIVGSTVTGSVVNGSTFNSGNIHITNVTKKDDETRMYIESTTGEFGTYLSPGGCRAQGPDYYSAMGHHAMGVHLRNSAYRSELNENGLETDGTITARGNLQIYGTKNRIVQTKDYGKVLHYAYETASPYFGDIGEAKIGEDGKAYIEFSPVFFQTIEKNHTYQVFLQAFTTGTIKKIERKNAYFIVYGTAGLEFAWEIKAKQKGYAMERLEKQKDVFQVKNKSQQVEIKKQLDYGTIARDYFRSIKNIYEQKENIV